MSNLSDLLRANEIRFFTESELIRLRSRGIHEEPPQAIWGNIIPTVKLADAIRTAWGSGVQVLSAYRPGWYNEVVGGSQSSEHVQFRAMDIRPLDGDLELEAFYYVCRAAVEGARAAGWNVGMGIYDWGVHIDVGASDSKRHNRNWDRRTQ